MPYENRAADELVLRDRLAIDRTNLANERTLLAYVRTAFMLLAAGGAAIKALPGDRAALVTGWALVAVGAIVACLGGLRFVAVRRVLKDAASRL
jgi:putative membrane protein